MHKYIGGPEKKKFLQDSLLKWYVSNKRDFPWRKGDVSNYQIIVSEIFLQRTQAQTVSSFYNSFFIRFPDWESLVESSIEDLEKELKPLGLYKQRARKLFNLATELRKRGYELPETKDEAREIGVSGLYISNAFELFILKKRAALLDVNMARVLSRYFHLGKKNDIRLYKSLQMLSNEIVNIWDCKHINWAFLDFASLICKARNPKCKICTVKKLCCYYNYSILNKVDIIDGKKVSVSIIEAIK